MKQQSIRDFITGLVAILGIAGLSFLFILFGQISEVTKKYYEFKFHVPTAAGLRPTAGVLLNGVRVGQLRGISILPGNRGVEITAGVIEGTLIPKAVSLTVESSFVGETSLEMTIPRDATDAQLADSIKPGETVTDKELRTLFTRITEGVQQPMERLTRTADRIDELAIEYTKVGRNINELLEPRTIAEVESGKPANIRSAIERLNSAIAGADTWLKDDELRTRTKDLITKADNIATQVASTVETIKSAATKVDGAIDTTTTQITAAAGTLNDTLRGMQSASDQLAIALEAVNKGEGTMGQLISNPDLYHSLNDAAKRLEKALAEVELLAQKIKAEGVKVGL